MTFFLAFWLATAPLLTWTEFRREPAAFDEQTIQIRGFLYELNGQKILASQPNLKSCCVGHPDKITEQLLIEGNFEPLRTPYAIRVEGLLHAVRNQDHTIYKLENAKIIRESSSKWFLAFFLFAGLGLLWTPAYKLYRKFRN